MTESLWKSMPKPAMRKIQREAVEAVRDFMRTHRMSITNPENGANVAIRVPSAMRLLTEAFGEALYQTLLETEQSDNTIDELQDALIEFLTDVATDLRRDYGGALDSAHKEPGIMCRMRSGEAESSTIMADAGLVRDPSETEH